MKELSQYPTPMTEKAASRDYAPLSVPFEFSCNLERMIGQTADARDNLKEQLAQVNTWLDAASRRADDWQIRAEEARAELAALRDKSREDMMVMNERLIARDQTIMREGLKQAEASRKLAITREALQYIPLGDHFDLTMKEIAKRALEQTKPTPPL